MLTASTITAWLASQGASLLLGFLAKIITDVMADRRNNQAQRDLGAAETAASSNAVAAERTDAIAKAAANAPDDRAVSDRLREGTF